MSALSHQREVGGPIDSIIPFLSDNSRIFYFFLNYFEYSIHKDQSLESYEVIIGDFLWLRFINYCNVTSGFQLIVNNYCFIQFSIFKDSLDMFTNVLLGGLKELS